MRVHKHQEIAMKTGTKTTLILSTFAVLSVAATAAYAQNYVTYSSAYGNATASTVAPVDGRISASDLGYQGISRQRRLHAGR
jgi:hypothetical protein